MHNDARHFEQPHSTSGNSSRTELRITTNRGGYRVFSHLEELRLFSIETARDVATLTAVLMESTSDDGYIAQTLGLLNDLSFQLQQCVEMACEATAGSTKP